MRRLLGGHLLYPFPSNPHPHLSFYMQIMHHLYRIIAWWCLYKQLDPRLIIPGIHNLLSHDPHVFKDSKQDKIRNKAHVEEPFRRLEKLYISTCMLTMHPLNILNMWPIIYNKLIVAGAGPVHSCMCNRLLIQ